MKSEMIFYKTGEHPCSYLEGLSAQTIFLDPEQSIDSQTLDILNENGFRRSGSHIYRPDCALCKQCLSSRVAVDRFKWTKSLKRVYKKNTDISISVCETSFNEEHYQLFEQYINSRHQDGDMYPTSKAHYQDFLLKGFNNSYIVEFRLEDKLIGCTAIDELTSGLSAIYTWFDASYSDRSIGTLAILHLIQIAEKLNLPFVYLGYWIKDSPKMAYKSRFLPFQAFKDQHWQEIFD